jgi:hypothetical protein
MKLFENCQFFILCDHCQNYMVKKKNKPIWFSNFFLFF